MPNTHLERQQVEEVTTRIRSGPIAIAVCEISHPLADLTLQLLVEQGFSAIERMLMNARASIERLRPALVVAILDPCLAEGAAMIRHASQSGASVLVIAPSKDCWLHSLEAGADACLAEPEIEMLEPQVNALRRRLDTQAGLHRLTDSISVGPFDIGRNARKVTFQGVDLQVTRSEFLVLEYLVENAGRVVSDDELLANISYGRTFGGVEGSDTIKQFVYRLRRKFLRHAPLPNLITNVRGFGYMVDRNSVTFGS